MSQSQLQRDIVEGNHRNKISSQPHNMLRQAAHEPSCR